MQLESLSCNNCGAPIGVPQSANFITCAHCGSRLAVRRTETAHYTEVLDRLQAHAVMVDRELQDLRLQNDLLLLDQAWEEERKQYMVKTIGEAPVEPSLNQVILSAVGTGMATVIGIVIACASISRSPSLAPYGGGSTGGNTGMFFSLITVVLVIMIAFSLSWTIFLYTKYNAYKSAEANYLARRNAILNRHHQG